MDQLPGNSNRPNRAAEVRPGDKQEKKIEPVVSGGVQRRKKPMGRRITETFFGADARNAAKDTFFETVIPGAQEAILNGVNEALQRAFFKEVRFPLRGPGSRGGILPIGLIGAQGTNYNRISTGSHRPDPRNAEMSRRARATFDFDEIVLGTRIEAMEVLERLESLIEQYEAVSVADLYNMINITPEHTDNKFGWTENSIGRFSATKIRGGYVLNLPRPEPLD